MRDVKGVRASKSLRKNPKVAALRLLPLSLRHDLSQDRELGVQSGGYASWHMWCELVCKGFCTYDTYVCVYVLMKTRPAFCSHDHMKLYVQNTFDDLSWIILV